MAKETVNQQPEDVSREEFRELAQDANFEVFQLAKALRKMLTECEVVWEGERAARGMLLRIEALTDIVYEAYLTDEENLNHDMDGLRQRLGLPKLPV